jgi:hypothetical protein
MLPALSLLVWLVIGALLLMRRSNFINVQHG